MADSGDPCRDMDGQDHHILPAAVMRDNADFLRDIGFVPDSSHID